MQIYSDGSFVLTSLVCWRWQPSSWIMTARGRTSGPMTLRLQTMANCGTPRNHEGGKPINRLIDTITDVGSRIKRLLVQLFFKINQQHKWKGSHKTMPSSQSSERLSPRLSPNHQETDNPSWSATNSRHRSSAEVRQPADVNNRQRGHSVEDAIDVDSFAFYESFAADQKPDQSGW